VRRRKCFKFDTSAGETVGYEVCVARVTETPYQPRRTLAVSGLMIPFIDLATQQALLKPRIDAAIQRVLAHGAYVMGPEVRAFEDQLAAFGRAKHALSCGNGTDAIALPLMAWEIGAGDAVFCPSFTFAATPEVIAWTGATPVFVDVLADTYNLDPDDLEAAIAAGATHVRIGSALLGARPPLR